MAIEDIPCPGDTDLTKFPPPKEGERWSITRWGIEIDGVGPFPYDDPPPEPEPVSTSIKNPRARARRAAARRAAAGPGGGGSSAKFRRGRE